MATQDFRIIFPDVVPESLSGEYIDFEMWVKSRLGDDFASVEFNNYLKFCYDHNTDCPIKFKTAFHHILPKSVFPEIKNLSKFPWNGVNLTHEDHYIAHSLLASLLNHPKIIFAWNMMNKFDIRNGRLSDSPDNLIGKELYSELREKHLRKNSGKTHPNYGNRLTFEEKLAIGNKVRGEKNGMFGKKHSEISRKKMSDNTNQFGSKNPRALKIKIFNSKDELIMKCYGNLFKVCKEKGWPYEALRNSYSSGKKVYSNSTPRTLSRLNKLNKLQFQNWYAEIEE